MALKALVRWTAFLSARETGACASLGGAGSGRFCSGGLRVVLAEPLSQTGRSFGSAFIGYGARHGP